MLIEAPYKKGDTVSIKPVSGEEIVARVESIDDASFKLHKPLTLMQGPKGLVLGSFMMTADPLKDITLPKTSVMVIAECEKETQKKYIEVTTGIKTLS